MVYPDELRLKADSSASLRNDKQIGLQQFRHCSNSQNKTKDQRPVLYQPRPMA